VNVARETVGEEERSEVWRVDNSTDHTDLSELLPLMISVAMCNMVTLWTFPMGLS
jgi:hypothetical protein